MKTVKTPGPWTWEINDHLPEPPPDVPLVGEEE